MPREHTGSSPADDEERAAARTARASRMDYGDYLNLDDLVATVRPVTQEHDERLFMVQHLTMELWMGQVVHELDAAIARLDDDQLRESFKMLTRVARIFDQLNLGWNVLRTLTPREYLTFRDALGTSSGFQSWQYRAIEFLLGNKDEAMLAAHVARPAVQADLRRRLHGPDLYQVVVELLARRGLDVPTTVLQRDSTRPHEPNDRLQALWADVYRHPHEHWDLYELAEKLVDLEDAFRRWRFNHVTTVERIIGGKPGTGGTGGVSYLRKRLDVVLFADLWQVRSIL